MLNPRKIYLVCPVREVKPSEKDFLDDYVAALEFSGCKVHYPPRDVEQDADKSGLAINAQHREAMGRCDEVHIYWTINSEGSRVDFGMAFMARLPIRFINYDSFERTSHKSYINVLKDLHDEFSNRTFVLSR